MESLHHEPRKRHARLRHQPQSAPLWVGDPDDWALVRHEPRPPLVCPEPGCDIELISYENLSNKYNPRIFKFKSVDRSCDHWSDRGQGGGPETAQHEWMKSRLTRITRKLGYTATPEHAHTHADVFVHEASLCLEVQLVPTQFDKRTAARQSKGTRVCWLIREGLDTPKALNALFHLPAVRFRVIDKDNPKGRTFTPWDHPGDRGIAYRARLQVFGTVAHPPRAGKPTGPAAQESGWFHTGTIDGYQFLAEILSGRRTWHPPGKLGHRTGLWALDADVTDYNAFRDRQRTQAVCRSRSLPARPHVPADDVAPLTSSVPPEPVPPVTSNAPEPAEMVHPPNVMHKRPSDAESRTAGSVRATAGPRAWWQWILRRRGTADHRRRWYK